MDNTSKGIMFGILFFVFGITGILFKNLTFVLLALTFLIVMIVFAKSGNVDTKNKANDKLISALKLYNFIPDKSVISFNLLKGLAVNEINEQIAYMVRDSESDNFKLNKFSFKDIIEAKIITNHETVTSTSIGSTVARGAIGGLLFGGIGAIVSGATANKTSTQQIKELTLEVVVDDLLNPRYTLTFYKSETSIDYSNPIIQDIETWYRVFSVIIKRNNEARSV